jgi:hypothetical protein
VEGDAVNRTLRQRHRRMVEVLAVAAAIVLALGSFL